MNWVKKGLILQPTGDLDWMITHASAPFAESLGGALYRIYLYGRDKQNRSRPGYIEIDLNRPNEILYITAQPIMELGLLGTFDDNGVMPSWIVNVNGMKYLYYTGWTQGVTVPYYFYVGLAVSKDGGRHFDRISPAPILERNSVDPYLTASPCILVENGTWKMWYVSSIKRAIIDGKSKPHYLIKYAESIDGIKWKREDIVCIDFNSKDEYALARPCVIKENGIYKMWYSYAGRSYRIGYAESKNGIQWVRKDHMSGIDVSLEGWDSEMIEYSFVFEHHGKKYMLYNGNDFGRTGLGYAVLDVEG
jgi:predicted GH43/DUF377 family glycosyl hydrolase